MKKILIVSIAIVTIIIIASLFSKEFTYVWAEQCKVCHKTEKQGMQHPIWVESGHSKSFTALTSEKAIASAKEKELVPLPPENPECLKCHAPLSNKAPELRQEGVTCEVCHGPGSEYKKISVMKNREEAVKNGLIVYESTDAIKAQCLKCHENAHEKEFNFAAAWDKIKHPIPEK